MNYLFYKRSKAENLVVKNIYTIMDQENLIIEEEKSDKFLFKLSKWMKDNEKKYFILLFFIIFASLILYYLT